MRNATCALVLLSLLACAGDPDDASSAAAGASGSSASGAGPSDTATGQSTSEGAGASAVSGTVPSTSETSGAGTGAQGTTSGPASNESAAESEATSSASTSDATVGSPSASASSATSDSSIGSDARGAPGTASGTSGASPLDDGATGGMGGTANEDPLTSAGGAGGTDDGSQQGGTTLGCTGDELLCEDFESAPVDGVPTGPWVALDSSCEFQLERFRMGVTSALAHGGSQSLEITNKHDPNCRFSGAFDGVDEFWVRAYMYWEMAIDLSNRETLAIDLTPGYRTADDPAVRFGYRSKAPCQDYAGPQVTIIGIGGGEATGCGSRPLPQGEWYCFEAHVQQLSALEVNSFINGEAISYQSVGKEQTPSIATENPITEKIDHIRLGIFSTSNAEGKVYVDDVAVATTRLGCPGR